MNWTDLLNESDISPLYQRIVDAVAGAVADGRIREGERLPTNRELSQLLKVDRSTVSRAYNELALKGLIDSQVGRGTYVKASGSNSRNNASAITTTTSSSSSSSSSEKLDWNLLFSRYAAGLSESMADLPELSFGDDVISFAGGIPSHDSYPEEEFKRILRELIDRGEGNLFDYSPFTGEPALRQAVINHLRQRCGGMVLDDQELLILSGSQQGIDLVANLLIDPGDAVIVEEPTYFWAISNFRARQAEIVGCPMDEEGINLAIVERNILRHRPKFIYVMPNNQNPTGITMSLARREGLLALAGKYQIPILEDDFCGDLTYVGNPLPALRTLPGGELVIYQGTFSKALCPGVRLGWLVAAPEVISRLSFAKRTSDLASNSMAQVMLTEFLKRGLYQEHLARVKKLYGQRLDTILGALQKNFAGRPVSWTQPQGGLFIWLTMPEGTVCRDFLKAALDYGVVFSPGDLCFTGNDPSRCSMRLSFIQNDERRIEEGIKRLASAFDYYFANYQTERPRSGRSQHVLI